MKPPEEYRDLAVLDVDTQEDFMRPGAALHVPGAERLVPAMEEILRWARENRIPVVASADAHPPDDPEFADFPPHCVKGTPGQKKIPETTLPETVVIPMGGLVPDPLNAPPRGVLIEKVRFDLFTNPTAEEILARLGVRRFLVFGVATDYCVKAAVLGLRARGYEACVLTDAIAAVTEAGGREALREMEAAGARLETTASWMRLSGEARPGWGGRVVGSR